MTGSPAQPPESVLSQEREQESVEPAVSQGSFPPDEQGSMVRERPRTVSREEVLVELLPCL